MRGLLLMGLLAVTVTSLAAGPVTVIAYGDSITAGGALPAAERPLLWVSVVETASNGQLIMVNEGKGGRPTDSIGEFEAMFTRRPHADILLLALGMNDSRDISDKCVPKAVTNLRAMVDKARKAYGDSLKVLIVGPTNIRKDALGPTKGIAEERAAKLRELNEGFRALAGELQVSFVSLYGVVPESSLSRDGVHPDGAGNGSIAAALKPLLMGLAGKR